MHQLFGFYWNWHEEYFHFCSVIVPGNLLSLFEAVLILGVRVILKWLFFIFNRHIHFHDETLTSHSVFSLSRKALWGQFLRIEKIIIEFLFHGFQIFRIKELIAKTHKFGIRTFKNKWYFAWYFLRNYSTPFFWITRRALQFCVKILKSKKSNSYVILYLKVLYAAYKSLLEFYFFIILYKYLLLKWILIPNLRPKSTGKTLTHLL